MYDYSEYDYPETGEKDLGTPEERRRILSTLKEWAENHPNQNMPLYLTAIDMFVTPGEIIAHIEDETAIGIAILDVLVIEARKLKELTRSEIKKFLGRQFPLTNFKEAEE